MASIGLGQPFAEPMIARVEPGGAADKAGVRAGDRVLSIDNQPIPDSARVQELMRNSAARGRTTPVTDTSSAGTSAATICPIGRFAS